MDRCAHERCASDQDHDSRQPAERLWELSASRLSSLQFSCFCLDNDSDFNEIRDKRSHSPLVVPIPSTWRIYLIIKRSHTSIRITDNQTCTKRIISDPFRIIMAPLISCSILSEWEDKKVMLSVFSPSSPSVVAHIPHFIHCLMTHFTSLCCISLCSAIISSWSWNNQSGTWTDIIEDRGQGWGGRGLVWWVGCLISMLLLSLM